MKDGMGCCGCGCVFLCVAAVVFLRNDIVHKEVEEKVSFIVQLNLYPYRD